MSTTTEFLKEKLQEMYLKYGNMNEEEFINKTSGTVENLQLFGMLMIEEYLKEN